MTIHPDITRRMAAGLSPQEAYAQAMLATIPPHLRKAGLKPALKKPGRPKAVVKPLGIEPPAAIIGKLVGNSEGAARLRARRHAWILDRAREGHDASSIALALRIDRRVTRDIIKGNTK